MLELIIACIVLAFCVEALAAAWALKGRWTWAWPFPAVTCACVLWTAALAVSGPSALALMIWVVLRTARRGWDLRSDPNGHGREAAYKAFRRTMPLSVAATAGGAAVVGAVAQAVSLEELRPGPFQAVVLGLAAALGAHVLADEPSLLWAGVGVLLPTFAWLVVEPGLNPLAFMWIQSGTVVGSLILAQLLPTADAAAAVHPLLGRVWRHPALLAVWLFGATLIAGALALAVS